MNGPSRAPQRLQQPQGTKSGRSLERGNALGAKFNPPSLDKAVLPVLRVLALPALVRGVLGGGLPCQGGCRKAAELVHVLRSRGASSGSEASFALPKRQLEFPEPAQHPQGKPDSERQPKNSCPGHTHSSERRGSEKGDGLQLSKEQPPAQPWPRSASCMKGPLHPSEGQQLSPFAR